MQPLVQTIQRDSAITFPMFGNLTINPPSYFTVFGMDIYFYGVIIGLGFILGILYCSNNSRRFGIDQDSVYDVMIWLIPTAIIGARLYYVLFRLDYYVQHPNEIFAIHNGGLAIYGGVIAGVLVIWLVCRKKKIPLGAMLDLLCYGLLIGQILGRWGNFMNREAFGAETDIFCRMGLIAPDGSTVGTHRGIIGYTVGQRRGLGLSLPEPLYVSRISPEENRVYLSRNSELYSRELDADNVNFIPFDTLDRPLRVTAKLRYRHAEQPATVAPTGDGTVHVCFDEPQRAVTPGQAVVFYDGDYVIGGGIIRRQS